MNHVIVISPDRKFLKIMPNTDLDSAKEFLDNRIEYVYLLMEGSSIPESEKYLEIILENIEFTEVLILTTDNYKTYMMYMGEKSFRDSKPVFSIPSRNNYNIETIPVNILKQAIKNGNGIRNEKK